MTPRVTIPLYRPQLTLTLTVTCAIPRHLCPSEPKVAALTLTLTGAHRALTSQHPLGSEPGSSPHLAEVDGLPPGGAGRRSRADRHTREPAETSRDSETAHRFPGTRTASSPTYVLQRLVSRDSPADVVAAFAHIQSLGF